MIKKILLTLLLTTVGIGIQAKTIKYSQYVTYEGKVDANNLPKGKGKLITSYLVRNFATKSYDKSNDILEGEFDGGNVTNAKLYFESDKKNKLYKSVYKGTLKYSIEKDGLVIVYNLSDGVFTDNVSHDFTITPNASTRIIRYPMTDGTFGKDDGFLPVLRQDVSPSDIIEKYPGMKGIESVGISECYSETDYRLGREWEGIDMGAVYTVKFSEKDYYFNLSTRITGDNVTLRFTNGDVLDSERIRRHFSDGTYIDARNKDGRWDGSLYYAENNSYKGMFRIPELISFSDLIDAKSLNDFSINYTNGTLLKDGVQIQYTNGKTAEELAAEAAARKKEEEAKAAAAAKAKEKEEAERAATQKANLEAAAKRMDSYYFRVKTPTYIRKGPGDQYDYVRMTDPNYIRGVAQLKVGEIVMMEDKQGGGKANGYILVSPGRYHGWWNGWVPEKNLTKATRCQACFPSASHLHKMGETGRTCPNCNGSGCVACMLSGRELCPKCNGIGYK